MRKCSYCGTDYADDVKVCAADQTPLVPQPPPFADPTWRKVKALIPSILSAIGVVVGLCLVGILFYELQVAQPARRRIQAIVCQEGIRQLELVKAVWQFEKEKTNSHETPSVAELFGPEAKNGTMPKCPAGGVYQIGPLWQAPTCSIHSNTDDKDIWRRRLMQ